jgi:hypothetical protein
MQPLTHRTWRERYTELRPAILDAFPGVDRMELEAIADDFDALVELVQRATNETADVVEQRLRTLHVPELNIGPGESEDLETRQASLANLRLGAGFTDEERDPVVARLDKLNRRLKRFPADGTELLLSVKDRDTTSQQVTLECLAPKFAPFVATSNDPDLTAALMEVREDLWRQIDDAVTKRRQRAR